MENIPYSKTLESGALADIAGYVPAAAVRGAGATARSAVQATLGAPAGDNVKAPAFLRAAL